MERPAWAPPAIDTERPSPARVYDYLLGGSHNFAADRVVAAQMLQIEPNTARFALANREFLHRTVHELVTAGVRQFLDIGSGIPTRGCVHEIAQRVAPTARVVYVDIDPVAVAHSQSLLADNEYAGVVQADLRQPEAILADPVVRHLFDFAEPVAILLVSMLHFVPDEADPIGIVRRLVDQTPPGSYLVISHLSLARDEAQARAREKYNDSVVKLAPRTPAEIEELFVGFELVAPGLVSPAEWGLRPEEIDEDLVGRIPGLAGVGRKPER